MMDAAMEAAFHGGLKLPNGVRPKVSRFDAGTVLVQVEWDPRASDDDLDNAEDAVLVFIEQRRRMRKRLAAQLGAAAREGGATSDPVCQVRETGCVAGDGTTLSPCGGQG